MKNTIIKDISKLQKGTIVWKKSFSFTSLIVRNYYTIVMLKY